MPRITKCSIEIPNMHWIYRANSTVAMVILGAILTIAGGACTRNGSDITPKGNNAYQVVLGESPDDDRGQWDAFFNQQGYVFGKEPAAFVKKNVHLLPVGKALDIAMGEGRNAVYLAKKGFQVDGVDISEVALQKAQRLAREQGVTLRTTAADLTHYVIKPQSYDVIININYLQRSLVPQIKRGLKVGGVVVYENSTIDQLSNPGSQGLRRDYLLNRGELKELFKDFEIIVYQETNDGTDAVASLVARKTKP